MATHILGGSSGPGKAIRPNARVNRRTSDNRGLEARVAELEATTEHIQSDVSDLKIEVRALRADLKSEVTKLRSEFRGDFRLMFGAILTVVMGMVGMLVKIFGFV
jgi:outer membrane murein-binding lipoprotein Lpp